MTKENTKNENRRNGTGRRRLVKVTGQGHRYEQDKQRKVLLRIFTCVQFLPPHRGYTRFDFKSDVSFAQRQTFITLDILNCS